MIWFIRLVHVFHSNGNQAGFVLGGSPPPRYCSKWIRTSAIYISLQAWLISYNPHTITGVNQQNGRQKKKCSFLLKSNNRTYLHIIEHHLIIFNSVQYLWFLHVAIDLGPLLFDHAKHQRSHLRFQRVFLRFAPTSVISLIDRLGLWENLQKTMVFARTYTRGCCKILELVEVC